MSFFSYNTDLSPEGKIRASKLNARGQRADRYIVSDMPRTWQTLFEQEHATKDDLDPDAKSGHMTREDGSIAHWKKIEVGFSYSFLYAADRLLRLSTKEAGGARISETRHCLPSCTHRQRIQLSRVRARCSPPCPLLSPVPLRQFLMFSD